jgi:hypothetical protein
VPVVQAKIISGHLECDKSYYSKALNEIITQVCNQKTA